MAPWLIWVAGTGAVLTAMAVLWLVSLRLRDASIVDVAWGLGFVLSIWVYWALGPEPGARQWLLLALVTVWGLRLSGYIFWRNHGTGEDRRYVAMRETHGERFWWVSLFTVFGFQGLLIGVIALPLLAVQADAASSLGVFDAVGTILWAIGFAFEAGGDAQLARFKADPANRGKVLNRGFWRYTRHPNYFGDAVQWWGFWTIALGASWGLWTVVSPIVMTVFLVAISGVAMLEKDIGERRPEYQQYVESTPAFVPFLRFR